MPSWRRCAALPISTTASSGARSGSSADGGDGARSTALRDELLALLPDAARIDALLARTTRRELRAGECLMREGDAPDALYFVESGQLSAQLPRGDGREGVRLQTMHAGSMVGELGLLLGGRRSADVVADRDSVLRVISRRHGAASSSANRTWRARSTRLRCACSASASCTSRGWWTRCSAEAMMRLSLRKR